jgi:hypothetical protein
MPTRPYNLYLGNKMLEKPYFNAPWFDGAAAVLRRISDVRLVFNPAEHDRANGFEPLNCPNGSAAEAEVAGFNRRETLRADWSWIAKFSNSMIVGPEWMESTGAKSEVACHHALGLPVWEYRDFVLNWKDPDALQALVVRPLRPVFTASPVMAVPGLDDPDDGGFFCDCHG